MLDLLRRRIVVISGICFFLWSCQPQGPQINSELLEVTTSSESSTRQEPDEVVTVALVMKTLTNPFFIEMEKGARTAEIEHGIRLLVRTASEETSIEQQITIVEDLIQDDVHAIVIAPGDSKELVPVLKKAQDAGIQIINIDNQLDAVASQELGLVNIPFISVDNEAAAYLSAKYVSDQITSPSKVAIIEGIRAAKNADSRKNGALKAFQENPNITEIVMETANWKIDEAYTITQRLFEENPDIQAIFCANDMMALGAIQYLADTNQQHVMVAGFDALDEAVEAVRKGSLMVTIDQQAAQQGYLGVTYAMRSLKGEEIPQEVTIEAKVIHQKSLASQ